MWEITYSLHISHTPSAKLTSTLAGGTGREIGVVWSLLKLKESPQAAYLAVAEPALKNSTDLITTTVWGFLILILHDSVQLLWLLHHLQAKQDRWSKTP